MISKKVKNQLLTRVMIKSLVVKVMMMVTWTICSMMTTMLRWGRFLKSLKLVGFYQIRQLKQSSFLYYASCSACQPSQSRHTLAIPSQFMIRLWNTWKQFITTVPSLGLSTKLLMIIWSKRPGMNSKYILWFTLMLWTHTWLSGQLKRFRKNGSQNGQL